MSFVDRVPMQIIVVCLIAEVASGGSVADCNDNGIADDTDIADGRSVDRNLDGRPDECDLGACCVYESPFCEQVSQFECDYMGYEWYRSLACSTNYCRRGWCCIRSAAPGEGCQPAARFECLSGDEFLWYLPHCEDFVCETAALIRLRAVAVNTERVAPTTAISVHPGDSIEVEIYLSQWGPGIETLRLWQLRVEDEIAAHSGDYGSIMHRPVSRPTGFCSDTGAVCETSIECRSCFGGPNHGGDCDDNADCPAGACTVNECLIDHVGGYFIGDFVCSASSPRAGRVCQQDDECPAGACVVRPDFVFASRDQRICSVSTFPVRAGCHVGAFADPFPDGGGEYYAATAIFDVTNDALGEFTITVDEGTDTYLTGPSRWDARYGVDALRVTVVPPPPTGACCDCSSAGTPILPEPVCTNGATFAECQGIGQTWTEDATCAEITCECPFEAIPATSAWGLLVLALTLLIGIKVILRSRPSVAVT